MAEPEPTGAVADAAPRRLEVLDEILWRLRQEVLPARMIRAALSAIVATLAAEGSAILDAPNPESDGQAVPAVRHHVGGDATPALGVAPSLLGDALDKPIAAATADGYQVLLCPCHARFNPPTLLAIWRLPGAEPWSAEECDVAGSASGIIRVVLEHEAIQHELLRHARTDPLTGLYNRMAFVEELTRRAGRLEREHLPGTLLIVDLDDFKSLNDRLGVTAADAVLLAMTSLLRATFRPADLLGRIGSDEFAAWMDGADHLAAAERAEALRLRGLDPTADAKGPAPNGVSFSIGIGTRWPGMGEEIDALMHRVDRILRKAKLNTGGQWRVSQPAPE